MSIGGSISSLLFGGDKAAIQKRMQRLENRRTATSNYVARRRSEANLQAARARMLLTAQATGGSGSSAQSQAEGSLESQNSANMATAAQTAVLDNRQAELQKEMQKVQKNEAIVGGVISAGLSYSSGGTIQ